MTPVTLVEQHLIRESDPRFGAIDAAAFAAKNLYNKALLSHQRHFERDMNLTSNNLIGGE
jgi:hypothetical protein